MPKDRTVDRFFWDDPEVGTKLSRDERLLMIGCWTKLADDEGRFLADAWYIRKELFGYDHLDVDLISKMIQKISEVFRSWRIYSVGSHEYIQIDPAIWRKHQDIRWTCKSKLPHPYAESNGNKATSEDCGSFLESPENFPSRDARAVGLGSVGLSSVEQQCASELFDPGRNWKRALFDCEFWPKAWRRVAKTATWKSFDKKVKTMDQGRKVIAAMLSQKPAYEKRDIDKRPYMSTWLNQDRFDDEGPEFNKSGGVVLPDNERCVVKNCDLKKMVPYDVCTVHYEDKKREQRAKRAS